MKVTLDWITPDAERVIARHARVSTTNPDKEEYKRLLTYCLKHGHVSVFEQASASFEVITSRAISAQIIRHRTFCFQETSQRYCDPGEVLKQHEERCWDFELRRQDTKNRQNSTDDLDEELVNMYKWRVQNLYAMTKELYEDMLSDGVAKECARNILPMCTPTRIHMQNNIRGFIHYVGLRAACETQKEHREIAIEIGKVLKKECPVIVGTVCELAAQPEFQCLKGWLNV